MLKFFRRIRKSFLESGNLRRYWLYAAGEVLLVIIGVLIALYLANWNDQRKEKAMANNNLTSQIYPSRIYPFALVFALVFALSPPIPAPASLLF
jgi:hypothetical protein